MWSLNVSVTLLCPPVSCLSVCLCVCAGSTDELAQSQLWRGLLCVDPSEGTADICGVCVTLWPARQLPGSSSESELPMALLECLPYYHLLQDTCLLCTAGNSGQAFAHMYK